MRYPGELAPERKLKPQKKEQEFSMNHSKEIQREEDPFQTVSFASVPFQQ
jgi:hypothetical protein